MALVPPGCWELGLATLMLNLAVGDPPASPAGDAPVLAFLLPVREGPSKRPAGGKPGQARESLQKGTSPTAFCPPPCRLTSASRVSRTHVYHIYRYILYMISL